MKLSAKSRYALASLVKMALVHESQPVTTVLEIAEDLEISKNRTSQEYIPGPAFHEKSEKNKKTNQGGSYRREIAKKYKKPKTRGDKNYNRRNKKK